MKADSIVKWFIPKEERFHELLSKDTQNLVEASRVFGEIARSVNLEERRVKAVRLKALEHDGDQVTRQVFEALNSSFITPFDREDIRSLTSDLDDILDHLEGVAQYFVLFELAESPEGLRQFAGILEEMVREIDHATRMVWDLSHAKAIQQSLVRVSELENQGDALYSTVIADLFKKMSHDSVQIMKWKEVYDGLEEACDDCKEYTHVLGNVVLKNS